jgi:hypothetical protein
MRNIFIAAGMATALSVSPAIAQEAAAPQAAPADAATAAPISDEDVKKFARAVVDVQRIQDELAPRLQGEDAEAQQAARQEAQQRMIAAVQSHDLDPDTFNRINQAAQSDPQLVQRISDEVRALSGGR